MESLRNILSTEVSVMWLVAAFAAFFGWKVTLQIFGFLGGMAKRFGVGMVAASLMAIVGLSGAGWSVGEVATRSHNTGNQTQTVLPASYEEGTVNFEGLVAKVHQDSGTLYPADLKDSEDIEQWLKMPEDARKIVWKTLRTKAHAAPPIEMAVYNRGTQADPFVQKASLIDQGEIKIDQPAFSIQNAYAIFGASVGLVLSALVTFSRRVAGNKYDMPARM